MPQQTRPVKVVSTRSIGIWVEPHQLGQKVSIAAKHVKTHPHRSLWKEVVEYLILVYCQNKTDCSPGANSLGRVYLRVLQTDQNQRLKQQIELRESPDRGYSEHQSQTKPSNASTVLHVAADTFVPTAKETHHE